MVNLDFKLSRFRGLAFSLIHLSTANIIKSILTLFASLMVARILGPVLTGHVGTARLIVQYIAPITLGINLGMSQRIPILRGAGQLDIARKVRNTTLWFNLVICVPVFCVFGLILIIFKGYLSQTQTLVIGGAGLLFISGLLSNFIIVHMGAEKLFRFISLQTLIVALFTIVTIPAARWGLPGALSRLISLFFIEFALGWIFSRYCFQLKKDNDQLKETIKVGFPILIVAFIHQYTMVLDRTLVRSFMGAEYLGFYTPASIVIATAMIIPQMLTRVLYPSLSEVFGKTGDVRLVAGLVLKPLKWIFLVSIVCIPLGFFFIRPLILFAVPEFAPGIPAAQTAVLAAMAAVFGYGNFFFNMIRRQYYIMIFQLIGIIFQLSVSLILYYKGFGLTAFMIGTFIGIMIFGIVNNLFIWLIAKGKISIHVENTDIPAQ